MILFFLIFSNFIFSQNNQDAVIWEKDILKWNYFQKIPHEKNFSHAKSNINITSRWKVRNLKLSANILSEFHKSKSWLKGKETEHLLKYEQGHFDIIEYYARLFRKELATYRFESFKKLRVEMSALSKKYYQLSKEMQELYDLETNHSRIKKQQKIWDLKIVKLLGETNNFSNSQIEVDLNYLK